MTAPSSSDLIEALRRPGAYPDPGAGPIAVVQTHISMLFFTDARVYKVKKPVSLDFLDASSIDRRRHLCDEEVRLNRRLAPGTYLGVVPVVRAPDGSVRIGGAGEVIDHAVEMVRLPGDRMMSAMLDRGEVDNEQLDALVELLVGFHREAATGPEVDPFGHPEEIARQVHENLDGLDPFVGDVASASAAVPITLSATLRDHLATSMAGWLAGHAQQMERRVRDGRIREGHGDLHAGNICLGDDGIVIYDCIEFSRRFRCRDVACEMAFLAMDLDRRCYRGFAAYLLHRYAARTGDRELPEVAAFYKQHLAVVRGKVASIRAADPDVEMIERDRGRVEAMAYFHLAGAYTVPAALILMSGLPASGKSHAARAIARPFEAIVLRTDVVRKQLAGRAARRPEAGLDTGIYTPAFTRRTYAAVLERAAAGLARGRTVVVDATFGAAALRAPFLDRARTLGVRCVLVEMTCPEAVVRERLRARAEDADEPSDADWNVYQHARDRFEPPAELPEASRLRLDSTRPSHEAVAAVVDRLVSSGEPSAKPRADPPSGGA